MDVNYSRHVCKYSTHAPSTFETHGATKSSFHKSNLLLSHPIKVPHADVHGKAFLGYTGYLLVSSSLIPRKDLQFHVTGPSLWATASPPGPLPPQRPSRPSSFSIRGTLRRSSPLTISRPPRLMPNSAATTTGIMPAPQKAGRKNSRAAEEYQPPPYEPNVPEPTTRADFMKYWLPFSLDERTAQKLLWISEGGSKVARTSEAVCPYPARPERYDHSPQVLCKEGLMGFRGYWEVDYDGWVVIGAVLESAPRKSQDGRGACGLGENDSSWGAGWSGSCYQVWHNSDNVDVQLPASPTMGVYVDQPAGIIKFLAVEGEGEKEVRLIHKFKANIQEKIFPAFWIGTHSFCLLRKKDQ